MFGFRQNYSTNHALINLTKDIWKNLDEGKVGCVIFVFSQKSFDIIDFNVSSAKLEHYLTGDTANDLNRAFLIEGNKVSVNGFNSRIPHGSVLFFLYQTYTR